MGKNKLNVYLLYATKITAAAFNAPSTGYVFYKILNQTSRASWLVVFNTILAVLLIDLFFLWVLTVLEDTTIDPIKRLPMAISSIGLSLAIIVIGFEDEGLLSYAPRIGLLALVFNDLVGWGTDFWTHYNSREQIELRLRNKRVIERKKMEQKTLKSALKKMESHFEQRHINTITAQLGVEDNDSPPERSVEELPEHVFKTPDGYGWKSPVTGESFTEKSLGGPYTSPRGAQIALSRHTKELSKNGHQ